MSETMNLKITAVTPVAIGSGVELSPYADYVIDGGNVCFIDKKKMVDKIVAKSANLLDRYVYGVANGMDNNRSVFDLKSFLTGNGIVHDMDEIVSSRCTLTGDSDRKLPIRGIVKSPFGEPYFPGSSIKGALKTVLMYNWLNPKKDRDKENRVNRMIETVAVGGNFNSLEKEFEYKEDEITKNIIRKNTIRQITDSYLMPPDSTVVVDCYRKMPIRLECLVTGQTTEFELSLEKYRWADLAQQANNYTFDCLDRELDLLDKIEDSTLNGYYNRTSEIQDLINDELERKNSGTAYLRLGFGKGYYLNSLGIAIYDYVCKGGRDDLYGKFEAFINANFARKDRYGRTQPIDLDEFPKTRLFVTRTKEPLGWVKISKH
jgi:CRISPR-associated protein Csm5